MRAHTATMERTPEIAVVAEHLKSLGWVVVPFQPLVNANTSSRDALCLAMRSPILVDVIDAQESMIGLPAAGALPTIGSERIVAQLRSIAAADSSGRFGMVGSPLWSVFVRIGDEALPIRLVVSTVARFLTGSFFFRRELV